MLEQHSLDQPDFVELDRRFRRLDEDTKSEDAAFASYTASIWGKNTDYGWDDLLKEFRVVILGEPGSGKTWELRERVKMLIARNEFAFFINLDGLVQRDLPALFGDTERARYNRWRQSTAPAYFFLDSVDEAKFRSLSDFYSALDRFAKELGDGLLLRAKIFLSSRISEWKPASDAFEIRRLFPLPPSMIRGDGEGKSKPAQNEQTVPLVVHIQPLDQAQVECLARASLVQNVPAFIQALDQAFAWEFARRPLDVSGLISFWKTNGRVGSLTELVEFDVATKLRPRANRNEHQLSEAEALVGATWLAAANLFSRKFSFLVTDDASADTEALNPAACLPAEWLEEQVRALLNRAIFDGAVYGHFRFHHRRIGEFLAAKWLAARVANGCPQNELEHLLVANVRGEKIFRPSMRPVAAWLCIGNDRWNHLVRNLVVEVDPEVHLNFGDAAKLPIEYRRRVLRSLAVRSKQRKRTWLQTSHDSLARFADVSLAADIREFILDKTLALDFRVEMLEIVRHGRLTECLNAAIAVIASDEEPDELKQYAAMAIEAVGSLESRIQLAQVTARLTKIPNRLCAAVARTLYPACIPASDLVALLAKSEPVREFSVDLPYHLDTHLESALLPEQAGVLLKELLGLAQCKPHTQHGNETVPISERFYWVAKLVPAILHKLFAKSELQPAEVEASAEACQLLGYYRECRHRDFAGDEIKGINELSQKQPRVRQLCIWKMAAAYRAKTKKEPLQSHDLFDYWEVLRLTSEDFNWLLADAGQRADVGDRVLALRLAIEAWDNAGRPFLLRWRLRQAAKREPELWSAYKQSAYSDCLLPVKRFWYRRIHHKYGKWWWIHKFRDFRSKWWWRWREQFTLYRNLKLISSGKPVHWLERLAREGDEQHHSHWATNSWKGLEKKRGKLIAHAAKRGCIAVWRTYTPPFPHEKVEPNRTSIGLIVGLNGLQAEFGENPEAIAKLSESEAALAARYAMDELNGFPDWIEALAIAHPTAVKQVLCECLRAEWQFAADHKDTHQVMAKLSWRGGILNQLVHDEIRSLMASGGPNNNSILRAALAILTSDPTRSPTWLAQIAAQRVQVTSDLAVRTLWLSVWMQTDGEAAANYLESLLKTVPNADEIVIHLCSNLTGDRAERGPSIKSPSYLKPECLRRFIPIVYSHVRFSEDLDRSGEAYTPTARDDAQQFRGVLLDYLAKSDDPSATSCLRELADAPAMSLTRDWVLNLFSERRKRESDFQPWKPSDLRTFAQYHEVDPNSDKELFAIACKRIQELKSDVETSNNSLRDELPRDAKEIHLRRWLARKLNERSRNRYNVPQEPEIDLQQRPDLHFLRPGLPPVPVEVKLADLGWSVSDLIERLENQLVGQYLRDHKTDYGIYVIGTLGDKGHWMHPQENRKIAFAEVIELLSMRASELVKANPHIGNLAVVGIDFSEPNKP